MDGNFITIQEVLDRLSEKGVKISNRTLRHYAQQGLIRKPIIKNLGRGIGKIAKYDEFAVEEIYACWMLIHGLGYTPEEVKDISGRKINDKHKLARKYLEKMQNSRR